MTKVGKLGESFLPVGRHEAALAEQAVALILEPLARLMIDHGLQLPSMVELLKSTLVREAVKTYALSEKISTDTRIALLTGVHRKDVKRLRDVSPAHAPTSPMVSVASSVIARWISEPSYLNTDQSTRPLARTSARSKPGEPDFTTLVGEVTKDVGARAVLDELKRLGAVDLREDGYVVLRSEAFVPHEGLDESFHFLALNVRDHLATAVYNLSPLRRDAPMLEQSAFSQNLSSEQVVQLEKLARRLWGAALRQFLQAATQSEQRSQSDKLPQQSIRFGVYFNRIEQENLLPATNRLGKGKRNTMSAGRKPK